MDGAAQPGDADLSYPQRVRALHGEPAASDCLVGWVAKAYDLLGTDLEVWRSVQETLVPLLPTHEALFLPEVREHTEQWTKLAADDSLWCWVFVASYDGHIAKVYGTSGRPADWAFFGLAREAFDFLNWLLRRTSTFDEESVRREARSLWAYLVSGQETYEIGKLIEHFTMAAVDDSIVVGPGLELHRVAGAWAGERFVSAEDVPENRWAVTAQITRARDPGRYRPELGAAWTDPDEDRLIARGLLALRLVRPDYYTTSLPFRVGVSGYRRSPRRVFLGEWYWTVSDKVWPPITLTGAEVGQLRDMGQILRQLTPSQELLHRREEKEPLELALRAFSSAFTRGQWQDRVVDLAQVLEGLFARDAQEISHKVAMRAALLLGQDLEHSRRVMKTVKWFYDLRSGIVHVIAGKVKKGAKTCVESWRGAGTSAQATPELGEQAVRVGFEVVAPALRAFLRLRVQGSDPFGNSFIGKLDESAFSSEEREKLQLLAGVRSAEAVGGEG